MAHNPPRKSKLAENRLREITGCGPNTHPGHHLVEWLLETRPDPTRVSAIHRAIDLARELYPLASSALVHLRQFAVNVANSSGVDRMQRACCPLCNLSVELRAPDRYPVYGIPIHRQCPTRIRAAANKLFPQSHTGLVTHHVTSQATTPIPVRA